MRYIYIPQIVRNKIVTFEKTETHLYLLNIINLSFENK